MEMDNNRNSGNLKPYEKPTATELTREQAILKLRDHAERGDEGAKDLLARIFAHAPAKGPETNKK
jgi:hypothetical protein